MRLTRRPLRWSDIGQFNPALRKKVLKCFYDRVILPQPAHGRLNKHCFGVAPNSQSGKWIYLCSKCDQLFVFLTFGAMIEADRHAEAVKSCPASDKQKIGNLKCDTLRWAGQSGRNAAACQIAHSPAHKSTSPTAIVNAFKNPPIVASAPVEAFRFRLVERIGAPCRLRNPLDPNEKDGCGKLASRSLSLGEATPPSYSAASQAKIRNSPYRSSTYQGLR